MVIAKLLYIIDMSLHKYSTLESLTCHVAYLHKLLSASCPYDEVLWRVTTNCCMPIILWRCVLCHESITVGIYCHVLNSNKLFELKSCIQSYLWRVRINMQADLKHVGSNSNDGHNFCLVEIKLMIKYHSHWSSIQTFHSQDIFVKNYCMRGDSNLWCY
jgi:hypothetical protein